MGADVQSPDRRRADPAQLPTLVLQLSDAVIRIHTPPRSCGASSMRSNAVFRCARRWSSSATAWAAASAGCSSPTRATSSGARFSKSRPAKPRCQPRAKHCSREALIFRHRPEIGRVIFIAAPLRGSDLARNWVGRTGSTLVKVPRKLLRAGSDALRLVTFQRDEMRLKRAPNSVDSLAPNDLVVLAHSETSRSRPASRTTSSAATAAKAATRTKRNRP